MSTSTRREVTVRQQVEDLFLAVHRRNGGHLRKLNFSLELLDPVLGIDSLDLAEIMIDCETRFGHAPFDGLSSPKTWQEVVEALVRDNWEDDS